MKGGEIIIYLVNLKLIKWMNKDCFLCDSFISVACSIGCHFCYKIDDFEIKFLFDPLDRRGTFFFFANYQLVSANR